MGGDAPRWTWPRLLRLAALTALTLAAVDALLAPVERRLEARLLDGALRNAPGIAAADGSRRVIFDAPESARREAVGFAGSSISYGAGVADDETLPAGVAAVMRAAGDQRPVFNLSQAGGGPRDAIPVATAMGTHPLRLLMVEFQAQNFQRGQPYPPDEIGEDELPLLLAGNAAQGRMLAEAGMAPSFQRRVEGTLGAFANRAWRVYRIRGHLWIDDQFPPINVAWTVRRGAAALGVLPKRFQGQSTNIGRLPWRRAYRDGQVPSAVQRVTVLSDDVSEEAYRALTLLVRLARAADVPLVFYEAPLNVAFQREFHFMSEGDIARLQAFRATLVGRMRRDGMEVLDAPELPDEAYLDRAHLTPMGGAAMGRHLARYVATRLPPLGRRP
ncbi:MAG: hypothetical protein JWM10_4529 [Myxococcaceae bacterium]|nr:hypothetical protein [Myxococcaceae bacterium]